MSAGAIEIQGTLREDGTLVLDEKPGLPPGRVKVTIEPIPVRRRRGVIQWGGPSGGPRLSHPLPG